MSQAARQRQLVATAVVAVLVLLAGCSGFGGSSTATETGETPVINDTASPDGETADGTTGTDEMNGTVQNVSDVALGAEASDNSYTITMDTHIEDDEGAVIENRTLEVGSDGRVAGETRRRVTGNNESTLVTHSYTSDSVTFLRHTGPEVNVSIYERVSAENVSTRSGFATLDDQFAFAHEQTGEDTHRFTVDSVDQVAKSATDGTVENISVTVVVESGIVTRLDYDLWLSTADGPVEYHTTRTVSNRGSTAVSPPEWLQQAENRTLPLE